MDCVSCLLFNLSTRETEREREMFAPPYQVLDGDNKRHLDWYLASIFSQSGECQLSLWNSRTLTSEKRFDFDPRKSSFMAKIDATAIKNWFLTLLLLLCCFAHLNERMTSLTMASSLNLVIGQHQWRGGLLVSLVILNVWNSSHLICQALDNL